MIKGIIKACKEIKDNRDIFTPMLQVTEEVGELSTEVAISMGRKPISKGSVDGVLGEACDVIIASIDVIYQDNVDITEEEIEEVIKLKVNKWRSQH